MPEPTPSKKLIKQYAAHLTEDAKHCENTVSAYKTDIKAFAIWLRDGNLITATQVQVQTWIEERTKIGPRSAPRKLSALRGFYSFMMRTKHIQIDPTAGVKTPKLSTAKRKSADSVISTKEIDDLLQYASKQKTPHGLRDLVVLRLLCSTGMQISELLDLQIEDVSTEKKCVSVLGRGGKRRVLPISEETATALDSYLQNVRPNWAERGTKNKTHLILNQQGEVMSRQGAWKMMKQISLASGIPRRVNQRALRDAFAVHTLSQGTSLQKVQILLGHADPNTTKNAYTAAL
jgi:integrase/recombinase XerD